MSEGAAPLEPTALPVAEANPAPATVVAETPVADGPDASVVGVEAEAPAAEPAPAEEPALVAAAEKPAEPVVPPVEAKPEGEAVAEPAKPVYAEFKLPERIQAPAEKIEAFTGLLGKFNLTQEAGQELMDMHGAALAQMHEQMVQTQRDTFSDMRKTWREDFFKTAGNRADTMANDAKFAIQQLVKDTAQRKELFTVLDITGAGDNKHIVGVLAAAGRVLRERAAPPTPTPTNGAKSGRAADRRYSRT